MFCHSGDFMISLIRSTVQFSPAHSLAGGWSLVARSVVSQEIAGSVPF